MDLYKVEYTIIASEENYKALVLADSENDCITYLTKYVKGPVNVKFIDQISKVHGITDSIITKILTIYKKKIIEEYVEEQEKRISETNEHDATAKEFEPPEFNDLIETVETKEKKSGKNKD